MSNYNNDVGINKSIMRYFDETEISHGEILDEIVYEKHFHGMGMNNVVEITEEDISALRDGKVVMCNSGDFTDFLVMRVKREEVK